MTAKYECIVAHRQAGCTNTTRPLWTIGAFTEDEMVALGEFLKSAGAHLNMTDPQADPTNVVEAFHHADYVVWMLSEKPWEGPLLYTGDGVVPAPNDPRSIP